MSRSEPPKEVLTALQLTSKQFHISLDLADAPAGLTTAVIDKQYSPSSAEITELLARGFIAQRNGYFHTTTMASGLMKAIANYLDATS